MHRFTWLHLYWWLLRWLQFSIHTICQQCQFRTCIHCTHGWEFWLWYCLPANGWEDLFRTCYQECVKSIKRPICQFIFSLGCLDSCWPWPVHCLDYRRKLSFLCKFGVSLKMHMQTSFNQIFLLDDIWFNILNTLFQWQLSGATKCWPNGEFHGSTAYDLRWIGRLSNYWTGLQKATTAWRCYSSNRC